MSNSNNRINELKNIRADFMNLLGLLAQLVEVCKEEGIDSSRYVPLVIRCTDGLQRAQEISEQLIAQQEEIAAHVGAI